MKEKTNIIANLWWVCKIIFEYNKKYIFIILISMIITGIVPPVSTLVSQEIINGIQKKTDIKQIFIIICIYIFIDLFSIIFNYFIAYYKKKFTLNFSRDFDNNLLTKSTKLGLKKFENSVTYDMINRAQYEADGKLLGYFETFMTILSYIITMFSYLTMLLMFNPIIVGVIIIMPIIKFIISKFINIQSFRMIKERTNDSRKAWYFQYMITHGEYFKEIKMYGLGNYFIKKYIDLIKRFNKQDINLAKSQVKWLSITSIFEGIIDGIMFLYIIMCGYTGKILIGNVLTYMKTITQIKEQMSNILDTLSNLSKESLFIDELFSFFNLDEEKNSGTIKIDKIENIKIEHLYYKYREEMPYVLKDINLEINMGETIVIVGQNGSGKTTLIKIIMGFYDDYEGNIYINDINLKKIDKSSLLTHMATLFQDFVKYEATFRENIAYGNLEILNDNKTLLMIAKKFGIDQFIKKSKNELDCQLGSWFDEGKQVSIGQWQKIALSRAFAKNADMYILDEPNAALDAISEFELIKLYKDILNKKIGIIIAHKFNNLIKLVDKIIVLQKGEIIGNGNHENLIKSNDIYKNLYNIQNGDTDLA